MRRLGDARVIRSGGSAGLTPQTSLDTMEMTYLEPHASVNARARVNITMQIHHTRIEKERTALYVSHA